MSKIMVTGASGFIGKRLAKRLIQENNDVYGIVNSRDGLLNGILDSSRILKADLSDYKKAEEIAKKINPDIIFHLAAYPDKGNDIADMKATFNSNVLGTFNLLAASNEINYKSFVFAGSYKEYGNQKVPFTEHDLLKPLSCYAASKAAGEAYCRLFNAYGKPITIIRLAAIYGPGQQQPMLVPSAIKSALAGEDIKITSGTQARDFLYIDDAIDALLKASSAHKAAGETFNAGSGSEIKVRKIAEMVIRLCRSKSRIKAGSLPQLRNEVMHMCGDITKAKRLLSWSPKTKIEEGLKRTIEWHKRGLEW